MQNQVNSFFDYCIICYELFTAWKQLPCLFFPSILSRKNLLLGIEGCFKIAFNFNLGWHSKHIITCLLFNSHRNLLNRCIQENCYFNEKLLLCYFNENFLQKLVHWNKSLVKYWCRHLVVIFLPVLVQRQFHKSNSPLDHLYASEWFKIAKKYLSTASNLGKI